MTETQVLFTCALFEFDAGWSFKTRLCLEPMEVKERGWRKDVHLCKTQPPIILSPWSNEENRQQTHKEGEVIKNSWSW